MTGGGTVQSFGGSLAFSDVDLNDVHTASVGAPSATWSGGSTIPAASMAALASAMTSAVTTDSKGDGTGVVTYYFNLADKAADFLAQGETLKVVYNVTVSDGNGGTATKPVTLVITGTNDAPVVATTTAQRERDRRGHCRDRRRQDRGRGRLHPTPTSATPTPTRSRLRRARRGRAVRPSPRRPCRRSRAP